MIIKLTGNSSILTYHFEYHFQNDNFKIGLLGFYSTNLIQNITEKNNKLTYGGFSIPPGQYNFNSLKLFLQEKGFLLVNRNGELDIESQEDMDKKGKNSIFKLLKSTKKFLPVETVNIHCNLCNGMLVEGGKFHHKETDIIAAFRMNSYFNHPIIYNPVHPIYFPIQNSNIYKI